MHRDWIVRAHTFEHFERASAGDHEVFRDDLEPIDLWTSLKNVAVVLTSKPDAVAKHREVSAFHLRSNSVGLFAGIWFAARRDAFLGRRRHHVALALAGVLPLATALRALAQALALARISADTLDLRRRRGRAGTVGSVRRVARKNQRDGRRQHRPSKFSFRHYSLSP